jgi:hypothetical protein
MADVGKDYITNSSDPKNIQDLTQFVSSVSFKKNKGFVLQVET